METLQFGGVMAFIYGILWASAVLKDGKAAKIVMTVAEYHRLRNHLEDKVIKVRRPAAEFAERILNK